MSLPFPEAILHQHSATLGKTGAGKSSVLRDMVEDRLDKKKRTCIVDPKGDWWGLKVSADGKSAGYPVITFGNFKNDKASDVPINEHSGAQIAELIASGNRPCVIGFRGWMPGQMVKFWLDFLPTLFNKNEGELYVFVDEMQNFAPKGKIQDPQAGMCVHWTNKAMSESRGLGMTFHIASQRSQKVHNDTLDCCETLIAMRTAHPAARKSIEDWINSNGDPAFAKEVLTTMAELKKGEAWVWSPENGFGPKRVQFPMFRTFDSFAPPQLQKKVSQAGWSEVDLDQVREKLATVIAEQKANDPKELKAQLAQLRRELATAHKGQHTVQVPVAKVDPERDRKIAERAVAQTKRAFREQLQQIKLQVGRASRSLPIVRGALESIEEQLKDFPPEEAPLPVASVSPVRAEPRSLPARTSSPAAMESASNNHLPPGERAVLIAAGQFVSEGVQRDQLSVLTGYKRSSRDAYIARLLVKEFIQVQGQTIKITEAGELALGSDFEPLPTGDALQQYWFSRLPEGESKILKILVRHRGDPVQRDSLDEQTGYQRSSRDAYIARLTARRLVEAVGRGEVKASSNLLE
jgi:hypothetical protein